MNKEIKKNFIYNFFYQLLILIIPLITVPYVSRILGARGVGIYSYTYSIVYYFVLVAMLGINNYGNRLVAKVRDNRSILSKTFISLYLVQLIMSIIMILFYGVFVLLTNNDYKIISILQGLYLVSTMFDINWFFFGLEKFKITVARNTIIKLLSLVCIFVFVNTSNDIWIYTCILSLSTLISNLLLFPFLLKEIDFVKISFKDVKCHFKPLVLLFIPVLAVSLYKIMDKIMIGLLSNLNEVGYYEQAEKIVSIPMGLATALGTVMLPRMSNLVSKGDSKTIKKYIKKSISFMMFLSFPICFGLIAISNNFVPLFLGKEFTKSVTLIYFLAPTITFISFANVIRTQYLIPNEKDITFIFSVVGGAIINFIINIIFISKYMSIGACFGTIVAELFVMLYQSLSVRNELPIKQYLLDIYPFLLKSIIMFLIVIIIGCLNINIYLNLSLQIFVGTIIYILLNISFINNILRK